MHACMHFGPMHLDFGVNIEEIFFKPIQIHANDFQSGQKGPVCSPPHNLQWGNMCF